MNSCSGCVLVIVGLLVGVLLVVVLLGSGLGDFGGDAIPAAGPW